MPDTASKLREMNVSAQFLGEDHTAVGQDGLRGVGEGLGYGVRYVWRVVIGARYFKMI